MIEARIKIMLEDLPLTGAWRSTVLIRRYSYRNGEVQAHNNTLADLFRDYVEILRPYQVEIIVRLPVNERVVFDLGGIKPPLEVHRTL